MAKVLIKYSGKEVKKRVKDDDRLNFCIGFIGTNRTGKSSEAKAMIRSWKLSHPGDLVVSHDPQDNFEEETDLRINPNDEQWAVKCCELRNCLIVLDDFRLINEKNTPVDGLKDLLYFRAKWNIDIIHICHNPSLLLNAMAFFTSHYYIFFTNAQEGSFKKKIPNYSLCEAASARVNKYVSLFGRGKHKKDKDYNGQDFPYIIVDCEEQSLKAVNMTQDMSKMESKVK